VPVARAAWAPAVKAAWAAPVAKAGWAAKPARAAWAAKPGWAERAAVRYARVSMDVDAALAQASEENDLPTYYRACVRPLLRMPESQWPACCGASCDPCTEQLVRVARRVAVLLADKSDAG
jgi:hypothetical protein